MNERLSKLARTVCRGRLWHKALAFLEANFEFIPAHFIVFLVSRGASYHTAQRYLYIAKQLGLIKLARRRGRLPIYVSQIYKPKERLYCPEHGYLSEDEVFVDEAHRGVRLLRCIYCGSIARKA
ncbi:MAG: hypothetical protein DRO09_02115 [Thermoprotei archaeon]|nr:MAG: hypothetical protein DRO09_02115 [Thermoprotei archaeon]